MRLGTTSGVRVSCSPTSFASAWLCWGFPMLYVMICAPACRIGRPSVSRRCTTALILSQCKPSRFPVKQLASISGCPRTPGWLAMLGSGGLEPALKALAQELNVDEQVRFLGQVAYGRRYFKAFDVFALK